MSDQIFINLNPNSEIRRVHVCYYVKEYDNTLNLVEISNVFYQHPDGPAEINRLEFEVVKTIDVRASTRSNLASEVFLLYHQQNITRNALKGR